MSIRKPHAVRSLDSDALSNEGTYDVRTPDQAARLWAEDWLDTSGDSCTVLVTCGEESWRFDVSVTAPEYDVKEAAT